jgi:hypothetical protein
MLSDQEFVALMKKMVRTEAPRLFAIVQEYGNRVDAECVGWGLAFKDHTDVLGVSGDVYRGSRSPDDALRDFQFRGITPHILWVK